MAARGSRARRSRCRRAATASWAASVVVAWAVVAAAGAERTLVVQPGQTIRDLADEALGNPDLWRDLLATGGFESASEVTEGTVLRVPDLPIAEARASLAEGSELIQEAAAWGGSVFAAEALAEATELRDEARRDASDGRWSDALRKANEARRLAREARDLTRERREQAGYAVLAARQGQVQGRRAEALVWTERPVDAVLVENERLRTLSDSFAEVRFSDQSQIRLGENAQAVIQSMQVDCLNDRRRTTVSLVEGDAFALLGGGGRRDFDVQVEAVEARIDSKNFWVRRDGAEAKFANYDDRPVKVSAQRGEVVLGWNQGTVVSSTEGPAEPQDLLPPPDRLEPADDTAEYRDTVLLRWKPIDGAAGYAVEIDREAGFSSPALAADGISDPVWVASGLGRGPHYWRVRAIDEAGFPGAPSSVGRFVVETEGRSPYLVVTSPSADGPTGKRSLIVEGEVDPTSSVRVDGASVSVDRDGRFRRVRTLEAGANPIRVEARSPAGLSARVERVVDYVPGWFAPIAYDPELPRLGERHFVSRSEDLFLSGTTLPHVAVRVLAEDGSVLASTRSESAGRFSLAVPVASGLQELRVRVVSGAGFRTEERIAVTRDSEPPALHLPESPPPVTLEAEISVEGRVEPGSTVEVDGVPAEIGGDRFSAKIPLAVGANVVRVFARDAAGNTVEKTFRVRRDVGAPQVQAFDWMRDEAGRVVGLRVVADDPAGLRRVARFRWQAGGTTFEGTLRLQPDGRTYVARLPPREDPGEPSLVSVEIEDRAGNHQKSELSS